MTPKHNFSLSKISLLIFSTLLSSQLNAGLMRHDIDVQTYRDFGENRGAFKPGAKNVTVYNSDGTVSGVIDNVPDFSATNDSDLSKSPEFNGMVHYNGGYSTVFNPSYGISVQHVPYTDHLTWGKRFYLRNDGTLFNGSAQAENYFKLGETTRRAVDDAPSGFDYKITRYRSIVTEVNPIEMLSDEETREALREGRLKVGSLIARVGGGSHAKTVGGVNTEEQSCGQTDRCYGWLAGGLNLLTSVPTPRAILQSYGLQITQKPKTALDIGTKSGDSGSPVYWWDETNQKWWLIAANQAGGGSGYGKTSVLRAATIFTEGVIEGYIDEPITTSSTSSITWHPQNIDNLDSGEGKLTVDGEEFTYHGLGTIPQGADDAETQKIWAKSKDLIFTGGGTIKLTDDADINMGAGSLTFDGDYRLTGNGRLNSAGYIVTQGSTLTSQITGQKGDVWRKVGEGDLHIQGNKNNEVELNLGQGTTYLERQGGYAASHIRLASGRGKVVLSSEDQLKKENNTVGFAFGTRGGELDLNGTSTTWNDIFHLDTGATIANRNTTKASTFRFEPENGVRTFLGSLQDNLNVIYAPKTATSEWKLKGNSEIKGELNVTSGQVSVGNYYTPHAAGYVDSSEFESTSLKANRINVAENSAFNLGRKSTADADFTLQAGATLAVNTNEGTLNTTKPEQGKADGAVLNGNVNLAPTAKLTSNVSEGFMATINANVAGGAFAKNGLGTTALNGTNEFTQARIDEGTVDVADIKSLGTKAQTWSMAEQGVLNAKGNTAQAQAVLEKISTTSQGVVAFSGKLANYIAEFATHPQLYLGSTDTLELGETDRVLAADQLRLGGANGTVKVVGKLQDNANLSIGNGKQKGKVIIDSHNAPFNGNIDVNNVELVTSFDDSLGDAKILLRYGSTANAGLMKNINKGADTEGIILVQNESDLSSLPEYERVAIGARAGEKITRKQLSATKNGYFLGGQGELTVNSKLTGNHNVTIDGQGFEGGEIKLTKANDFTGNITVEGHRERNEGNITLTVAHTQALGTENTLNLVRNGVLNLNANARVKWGENDRSTTIKNSSATEQTLDVIVPSEQGKIDPYGALDHVSSTLFSAINGNIRLVKSGEGNLNLATNGANLTAINVDRGMLSLEHAQAVGSDTPITINNDAILNVGTQSAANVALNTDGTRTAVALRQAGTANINKLTLANTNQVIDFADNKERKDRHLYVKEFNLNGKQLTIQNASLVLNKEVTETSPVAGRLVLNNVESSVNSAAKNLFSHEGELVLKNGSVLDLRDYKNDGEATKEIILDNSSLGVAMWTNNGGGSESAMNNNITLVGNSVLHNNNSAFRKTFTLGGAIKGDDNAIAKITGNQRIRLTGDLSKFTGKFSLTNTLLEIDGKDGQIVNAGFTQPAEQQQRHGLIHNQEKTLILAGDNRDFTGYFQQNAENSKLVFKGVNAVPSNASEFNIVKGDVEMNLAQGEEATLNVKRTGRGSTGSFVKSGEGRLNLGGENNSFNGNYRIDEGTLAVQNIATLAGARAVSAKSAGTLQLNFDQNQQVNFDFTGEGNVLKTGSAIATFAKNMTYTGKTTVETGTLATKNLAGSLHIEPQGVVYMAQQAVEIAKNFVNKGKAYLNQMGTAQANNQLTVGGDYVGENGSSLMFDTELAGDNAATDKLIIQGNAQGETALSIQNFGGQGDHTPVGINLINVKGQSNAHFTLNDRYTAGAFEYVLQQKATENGTNWFLTSAYEHKNGTPVFEKEKPVAPTPMITAKGKPELVADKPIAPIPMITAKGEPVLVANKPTAPTPMITAKGEPVLVADKPAAPTPVMTAKGEPVLAADKPTAPTPVMTAKGEPVLVADKPTAPTPVITAKGEPVLVADKPTAPTPVMTAKGEPAYATEKPVADTPVRQTQRILRAEVGAYLVQLGQDHHVSEFVARNDGQNVWVSTFGENQKFHVEPSKQLTAKVNANGVNVGVNLWQANNWRAGVLLGAEKQRQKVDPTYTPYTAHGRSSTFNAGVFGQYGADRGVQFSTAVFHHWNKHRVTASGFRDDYRSKGLAVNAQLGYRFIVWDKDDFEIGLTPKVMYNLDRNQMKAHRDQFGNSLSSTGISQEVGSGVSISLGLKKVVFSTDMDYYKPTEQAKLRLNQAEFANNAKPYAESHTRLQWNVLPNLSLQTHFKKRFGNDRNREVAASVNFSF